MRERKITLGDAVECGAIGLLAYCEGRRADGYPCMHVGQISLDDARNRWGDGRRLDALSIVCSRCGAREADVRPEFEPHPSGRRSAVAN